MLGFAGVSRRFGALRALDDVSFTLQKGTFTALVGPNGSGKSTLLRVAATLDEPTAGRVWVEGAHDGAAHRKAIGYLGQEPALYEDLTARENLAFFAAFHGHDDPARVQDALTRFDVAHKADSRVRRLSRGERQRVALARATLGGPLLLLDEPTTALDPEAAALTLDALLALRGERTLLVATHDAALVARADRVLRLDAGRIVADGDVTREPAGAPRRNAAEGFA